MIEPSSTIEPKTVIRLASDGYPILTTIWPAIGERRGFVVVLHGVQSHAGWYRGLGRRLAEGGYDAVFPDRRGSGGNSLDRGHADSARRLLLDQIELLESIRRESMSSGSDRPSWIAVAGISWGGKIATLLAAQRPDLVDYLALICPGLTPRVGVSPREKLEIAAAGLFRPRKKFAIPLADPALFTASETGRAFIAEDPLSLREATASLLIASARIDHEVRGAARRIRRPVLLMLAGKDRIIDNSKIKKYFDMIASDDKTLIEYPEAHHTLEFEADPWVYAADLVASFDRHSMRRAGAGA
jgi:alpha-beta hydrolase superfamily lysophospholipase